MAKRWGVAALVAALLVSGMLVGVSFAGAGGIAEPQVIELTIGGGPGAGRHYPLVDEEDKRSGQINILRESVTDVEGNRVGKITSTFIFAKGVVWQDLAIVTLKPGPYTEAGTVALMGNFNGFNGESYAVTGGTGAYQNVRGFATLSAEGDTLLYTLNLTP